jgi:uncharacterized protein YegL
MENCRLVSDQRDVDIGGHKYVVGESSAAEMCHLFCKRLGRGHVHLVKCGHTKVNCPNVVEGQRVHQTKPYGPDFEATKDEVSHEAYWDTVGFEDPCDEGDKELFGKCSYFCASSDHGSNRQYCQLDLWHSKDLRVSEAVRNRGWVSTDGHFFICEHKGTIKNYHFVLCLDDSGSMNGKPWMDLTDAVAHFVQSRLDNKKDKLTIIQFNEYPIVMCESIHFDVFNPDSHLKFRAGGTDFGVAIRRSHDVIRGHLADGLTPVFVFMSDGKSKSGEEELIALHKEIGPKGLKVYTISFDPSSHSGSSISDTTRKENTMLKKLAVIAQGVYLSSITGIQLKENFMEISGAFRTTVGIMSDH